MDSQRELKSSLNVFLASSKSKGIMVSSVIVSVPIIGVAKLGDGSIVSENRIAVGV